MLCIGRLEEVKRPDHPIRVLAAVRRQGHDVALLLVGDGSQRRRLQALAEDLEVGAHVAFAGARDQEWLARVIPAAAVALSPLTGRALSEIALAGVPTVAYDADWQGELVRPGETGELVPDMDVAAMSAAAAGLLACPERARQLGLALRRAALAMMDQARLDQHEQHIYSRLMARHREVE
jgi:glycosyltransferase involved in cell wall biosynthesis